MSLKRNTLWNLAGTGLPFLLGAVTIPYLLARIGVEAFGILTLIWALIGYFSLFDFGLGRALTQQVASARSGGRYAQIPVLVTSGLWFTAGTGLLGGAVLAILANELAGNWLNVNAALQTSTVHALLIAALGIPLTTVTTGLRGILEAYEDFRVVNLLRIILGAANFGLPALSVMFIGDSLTWMVASLVAARAFMLIAHAWLVRRKLLAGWASARLSGTKLRGLLSFGAWMTISNIVSPLMVTADRFLISAVLGAGVVAYYTVPFEVLIRVLVVPASLTSALFPRLAAVMKTDWHEASRLYRTSLKIVVAVLAPICLLIAIFSKLGMTIWLGEDFAERSWVIVSIMAIGLFLNGLAHVPFAAIQASGDSRATAFLHIIELALYIPILYILIAYFGIVGAAVAWSTRVAVDLFSLLAYAGKKKL